MMEACLIARQAPGLGDPWDMTIAQWNGAMECIGEILDRENPGDPNDSKTHDRMIKRMKRKKRRQKASEPNG